MTKLADLLSDSDIGNIFSPEIGDVFYINLTKEEGIVPKEGETRNKFYIILGFDDFGNAYGGVIINSRINKNMPMHIQNCHLPIKQQNYSFLTYNSFIDCSKLFIVNKQKLRIDLYRGKLKEEDLNLTIGTLMESETANKVLLKRFHIGE